MGSFLNMVIWRLPRGISFVRPSRSFCPKCKHPLSAVDLIPLLSWLSTGGKCRYCKAPVASRYFWVEVLTGALFAGVWWRYLIVGESPLQAGFYMAAVALLVAIIFIDGELFIIPDEINALLLVVGITLAAMQGSLMTAIWGALLGWGLLFGIQLLGRLAFGKDAMGDGDIKMMRGVGALLGPALVVADVGIAVVLGLVGGIAGIALSKRKQPEAVAVKASEAPTVAPVAPSENKPEGPADSEQPSDPAVNPTSTADAVPSASAVEVAEAEYMPTPVPLVLFAGVYYLLCLDIVALFVPALNRWAMSLYPPGFFPEEKVGEEDDWKPSATTIPFGPYLAAGALICILFAAAIQAGMHDYFYGPSQEGTVQPSGQTPPQ
jgi:leader peptidase (prepilin peptidase)/N-methyltransferase